MTGDINTMMKLSEVSSAERCILMSIGEAEAKMQETRTYAYIFHRNQGILMLTGSSGAVASRPETVIVRIPSSISTTTWSAVVSGGTTNAL